MTARRLDDWNPLPAERKLAEGVGSGLIVVIGDGTLPPEEPPEDRRIRASFLRALILSQISDCPVHEKGVRVRGAHVVGDGPEGAGTRGLDLESCDLRSDLALIACRLPDLLLLRSASLRNLFLAGACLGNGLSADRLEAKGGVFLRAIGEPDTPDFQPFESRGVVRLIGAKLGGDLDCKGARLTAGKSGKALSADGLEARGSVFLRSLVAQGEVRLLAAKLGDNLNCNGAQLTAAKNGHALSADRLKARGTVFMNELVAQGQVRLIGAELGGTLSATART